MHIAHSAARALSAIGIGLAITASVAGCSNTVAMTAAPSANATACAAAQVRLPSTVDSKYRLRNTTAQSTAAWGDPTAALYRCGVAVPTVSDLPCFTLGATDWIRDDRGKRVIYTTFGRTPAVQVVIDSTKVTSEVLQDVGTAVATLPKNGSHCLDPDDVTK